MLNKRDLADRQIRAAVREYKSLEKERFKIIKLDQPIQKGWRRSYVLAEHATTRRDRPILERILKEIGTVVVHHGRDFKRRLRRSKKVVEIEQPLLAISQQQWEREAYPSEWRTYFHQELRHRKGRDWQLYWVFKQPSLFTLKVARNWLWYFREVDPVIETRLSELNRWLGARQAWTRYWWLRGVRHDFRPWSEVETRKERNLRREHKRMIARAYKDFPEVDLGVPARRVQFSFRIQHQLSPGVAQQKRHSAQTGASVGANPTAGTNFALVAQEQRQSA